MRRPARPRATPRAQGEGHGQRWIGARATGAVAIAVALLATIAVHFPALDTYFAQDDITFLSRARGLLPTPWSLARPLSEGWTWRLLHGLFGLNPVPYHLFLMALHLANTALVYAIGRRMLRSPVAGGCAAFLFGISSIAFTPLHWTSCLVELLVTLFSLAAFWMFLEGRERGSWRWLALGALAGLAAVLSKESAILFPLVLVVAHLRLGDARASWKTLAPQLSASAAYALGFVATLRLVHYVGSEAYSMTGWPPFLAQNLFTYLAWLASPHLPIRDAVAAMDPSAWRVGLVALAIVAGILWTQRRAARHPEEVGAVWFLAFLLPVVPLEHHTYLYYLYMPLPGLCWLLAGAGQRAASWVRGRLAAAAPLAAGVVALALAGLFALEFSGVRERERRMVGNFLQDKTVREALLLKNALGALDSTGLTPGARIAFVNPAPVRHVSLVDTTGTNPAAIGSYTPLEGALRNGESIRLFFPGIEYLGFARHMPREWEDADIFLYQDEGHLRHLGRGGHALAELGYFLLPTHEWARAETLLLRSRQLGDTLPEATFGLIITRDFLGDLAGSNRYAAEFLRRWPDDPRAKAIQEGAPAPR